MADRRRRGPVYRAARINSLRAIVGLLVRLVLRVSVEGREHLPAGPAILCFSHQSWADPLILFAVLPRRPKLAMFGPREADMRKGGRNRLISWAGFGIPYRPAKDDLLATTRRVEGALHDGWAIAIAGEGRIHRGERTLLPLFDGPALFALRGRVPLVPVAINGTASLGFRRPVRIRVGAAILGEGRPTRARVDALTATLTARLVELIGDYPDPVPPRRFGRWLTDLFNEWPDDDAVDGA